jgi:hypothetical protein
LRLVGRQAIDLFPKGVEVHLEPFASRNRAQSSFGSREAEDVSAVVAEIQDLQASKLGVDDPVVTDREFGILVALLPES